MTPDRHIYLATVVIALVSATAINVLAPRTPFQGTVVTLPQVRVASQAQEAPRRVVDAASTAPATPQRANASL